MQGRNRTLHFSYILMVSNHQTFNAELLNVSLIAPKVLKLRGTCSHKAVRAVVKKKKRKKVTTTITKPSNYERQATFKPPHRWVIVFSPWGKARQIQGSVTQNQSQLLLQNADQQKHSAGKWRTAWDEFSSELLPFNAAQLRVKQHRQQRRKVFWHSCGELFNCSTFSFVPFSWNTENKMAFTVLQKEAGELDFFFFFTKTISATWKTTDTLLYIKNSS